VRSYAKKEKEEKIDPNQKYPASHFAKAKSSCKAVGIVGMPNVGKSTLFNALTSTQAAQAANYPFCTIEPNIGKVAVPDDRLDILAKIASAKKTVYTQLEFVDIAGLVKGASNGEGLGNKFLGNIRSVSLIVQLVRCFEDDAITHVEKDVDPLRDVNIINTELALADLQSLEHMYNNAKKRTPKTFEEAVKKSLLERTIQVLEEGGAARNVMITDAEWPHFRDLHLLSAKPVLYVANVAEADVKKGNKLSDLLAKSLPPAEHPPIVVSAKIESEVANLDTEENKQEFLKLYGLEENGLKKIITASREMLGLQCFYTCSHIEARAWTIPISTTAKQAAGTIHSDFEKGFIKAETISYSDYVKFSGDEYQLRAAGKYRAEGASYLVKDGDVMHFKFS
jgi:GTP-binding protein YchF